MKKNKPPKELKGEELKGAIKTTSKTKKTNKAKKISKISKISKTVSKVVTETTKLAQKQKTTNDSKKKGLTSSERLNLMLILGGLIVTVTIAINFAVKYLDLSYARWTITFGIIAVAVMDAVTFLCVKDKMVNRRSRNAILYANTFAFVISVLLSSIYIAHSESTYVAVSDIFSQMNFSLSEINGKFFVDIMKIARLIPMINMGHICVVIAGIFFCIFRKLVK